MRAYERFFKYISYDTQSDSSAPLSSVPSTPKQKLLGAALALELKDLGVQDAYMDKYGYVYGHIPASKGSEALPALALISHMDTAPDMSGADIKARIIKNYTGKDIRLSGEDVPEKDAVYTRVSAYPMLKNYVGQDLIVTDGSTLLGADNKAGIAEIMTLVEFLKNEPSFPHPPLSICFTPDEEIGRSADHIDTEAIRASYGYTVDGGAVGDIQYENFNASTAVLSFSGITAHTGYAKGAMKNSALIAVEFQNMIPADETPEKTEGREGFYHLNSINGKVERTVLEYLIRDFSDEGFKRRKAFISSAADFINMKYGDGTVELTFKDSYSNMLSMITPYPELILNAEKAITEAGSVPQSEPIRGGTDGCRLSYMGLPCPNLCAGGQLGHGRHEFVSVQSMDTIVEILKNLVRLFSERRDQI